MKTTELFPAQEQNEQLVTVSNNQVVTTSLMVAEYFGKEHKSVLRQINFLECSDLFREHNFVLSCYFRKNGNITKSYPMYYLTRDGFTFLAMGFTGKVAAKFKEAYIEAFNRMEEMLRKNQATEYAKMLLKEKITAFNKRMKKSVACGCKLHGEGYGACGDMTPWLPFYPDLDLADNLDNILSSVNNSYLDSMYFIYEMRKNGRELEDLKKIISKFACDMQSKLGRY